MDDSNFGTILAAIILSVIITFVITQGITTNILGTKHNYWINGNLERIDNAIEMLVENPTDSLIVTHPTNPYPIGIVKFERKQ